MTTSFVQNLTQKIGAQLDRYKFKNRTAALVFEIIGNKRAIVWSLFRNKRFMLDEMFQQNASKFAIFLKYENLDSFFFLFRATLFFP